MKKRPNQPLHPTGAAVRFLRGVLVLWRPRRVNSGVRPREAKQMAVSVRAMLNDLCDDLERGAIDLRGFRQTLLDWALLYEDTAELFIAEAKAKSRELDLAIEQQQALVDVQSYVEWLRAWVKRLPASPTGVTCEPDI